MIDKGLLFKQTLGHFCVDATCAAVVVLKTHNLVSVVQFFVLYNFLAFCLQPLAGILSDRIKRFSAYTYIFISFILLLFGMIPILNIWSSVIFVGLGNCLFHVGAGTLILTNSQHKMTPLGIFVSSGAVGLFVGTILAHNIAFHFILTFLLMALIFLNLNKPQKVLLRHHQLVHCGITFLLCLCIAIRSFMGFMPLTLFEKTPLILWMITMGIFIGKALGGILCDKWGIQKVIYISTALVMVLFLFSFQNPYLWTIVQTIVNLSMPITLYLMYQSMPKYPAFSFGLAASFLVVGLLATFLFQGILIPPACFLILFVLNSVIILYAKGKLK